jgi:hypothetical protein
MRLKFVPPLLPTSVEKPPESGVWLHEVKFDGYRSQMIIDESGTRIFTRRGLDWTAKYRDLAAASKWLDADSAIIDGEIIVLNDAGLSDFAALRRRSLVASTTYTSSPSICCTSTVTICATWHCKSAAISLPASSRPTSASSSARRSRAVPRRFITGRPGRP